MADHIFAQLPGNLSEPEFSELLNYQHNNIGHGAIGCIIHRSSSIERLLTLSVLKKDGVSPVICLNWRDRCATLL